MREEFRFIIRKKFARMVQVDARKNCARMLVVASVRKIARE